MNHDIHNLVHWLHIFVWIAAICATSFPILYAFSPWWTSLVGRCLMLQSIAFAVALDFTLLFFYWQPSDILLEFWIDVLVFAFVAVACTLLTFTLIRYNYRKHIPRRRQDDRIR